MTASQKLNELIINKCKEMIKSYGDISNPDNFEAEFEEKLEDGEYEDYFYDAKNEIRGGEIETDISPEYSRHYEVKSVAAKAEDGSWIGWNYYYGGGKHGEPSEMDWIEDAYDLDCEEEEKLVIVRKFKKK